MDLRLPLTYVTWVDTVGSALMLALAVWVFYEAIAMRRRSFMHQYLFLLSCTLGAFAVSRALGHMLRNFLQHAGESKLWESLSPISGGVNTLIFAIIASLSIYYGIFRNVQEQRDRDREGHLKELQHARDFLQKVIDSLDTQLVVIDRSRRIVTFNEKVLKDYRLAREDILDKPCHQVLHRFCDTVNDCRNDETPEHLCSWKRVLKERGPVVTTHVHRYPGMPEPRTMEISALPVFGDNGEVEFIIEALKDVTDQVKMQEMALSHERLGVVVELASAVAHELNTPMFTVLGNAQLLKRRLPQDDRAREEVEAIIRNVKKMSGLTQKMTRITQYKTKDYVGGEKLLDIAAASSSGEALWDDWDVERAQREERWLHLEKMAAMGQLTASVAHELNNALNIVLGYSQLLLRDAEEGSRTQADFRKIERNAKLGRQIVLGLLDYTRTMARKKEPRDVNRHLEEVLVLVEHRMSLDGIEIVRDFSPEVRSLMMDANEMKQVYLNLLNNAADAVGGKGCITVGTRWDTERKEALISIADTGPGIPAEILHKIFVPFFSTKATGAGTGLGLNVSRDIVERHGGRLSVENRTEGGAVFRIRLPYEILATP
ncbi:MAG: PAS domain-containing protein [Deltaproteobacteria bacterium]|nr:PAS domain-containing protein [Deltaproteobacteria bacterium]